jgi:hypothetical protein
MSDLDRICAELCLEIDGCLALGVADLSMGLLLASGARDHESNPPDYDALAAASAELLRGTATQMLHARQREHGRPAARASRVDVVCDGTRHVVARVRERDIAVFLVTRLRADLEHGPSHATLEDALARVAAALP